MLLGLVVLLSGAQVLHNYLTPQGKSPALTWGLEDIQVDRGTVTQAAEGLLIRLNDNGQAIITFPVTGSLPDGYRSLHLAFTEILADVDIVVLWRPDAEGRDIESHRVLKNSQRDVWLSARELQSWSGEMKSFGIALLGRPDTTFMLEEVSVGPAYLSHRIRATLADWTGYIPWHPSSVNVHTGYTTRASYMAAPVFRLFWALSALAYMTLRFFSRKKMQSDWRVIGGIFLACWIVLDLIWQQNLLRQLGHTFETFYGKDTKAKLAAGPDGSLVDFIDAVKREIPLANARVFVASRYDYWGMLSNYYLYPHNVYWRRHGPELPQAKHLRSGDYIVLVKPTDVHFDPLKEHLLSPNLKRKISAEPVMLEGRGGLYKVK